MRKTFALLAALTVLTTSGLAAADEGYTTTTQSDGYSVAFVDDLLDAQGTDGSAALIKVRPQAARVTLIRPRTSFVPELLLSVDTI